MNKQQIESTMRACAARVIAEELKVDPNHRGTANLARALSETFAANYRIDTDWSTETADKMTDVKTGEVPVLVIRIEIDMTPAVEQTDANGAAQVVASIQAPFDIPESDFDFTHDELESVGRCADWLRGDSRPLRFVSRDDEPTVNVRRNWYSTSRLHNSRR